MEKEKRKAQPKHRYRKFVVAFLLFLFGCSAISIAVLWYGVGMKGYFYRFETPEEVIDFLYDNLEDGVSTPDDVLAFMSQYTRDDYCTTHTLPLRRYYRHSPVETDFESIVICLVHVVSALREGGSYYFVIDFYFDENNTLGHIDAEWNFSGL